MAVRYLNIFLIISILCLKVLAQSASKELYGLIKDSPEKRRAVFIGELHAIEEYQAFTKDLFVSLIENDTINYQIYLEFPFAANYIISEYLKTGNESELMKLSELVMSEKGYRYSKDFVLTLLKAIRQQNLKGKSAEVFFTDILHTDKMAFTLMKDKVKRTEENKFPLRVVDSLLARDSVFLSNTDFNSVKELLQVNEKIISEKYGYEIADWIKDVFALPNYSHLGKDTVIHLRDKIFFEQVKRTLNRNKKQLFLYGIAHIKNAVPKTSHQNLFELLQQNSLITEENALRIILITKKRDKIALPDLNAGMYGLTDYTLKKKAYRIFSRKSYPVKPIEQKDNVDYVILFREVHSLTKKRGN